MTQEAFEPFYRIAYSLVRRWQPDLQESDVDEVVQVSVTALLERLRKDPDAVRSPRSYLCAIVKYTLAKLAKQKGRQAHTLNDAHVHEPAAPDNPVAEVEAADSAAKLHDCLEVLDPVDRRIIALRFHQEQTLQTIGADVELSKAQVCRRLQAALKRLRQCMEDKETE